MGSEKTGPLSADMSVAGRLVGKGKMGTWPLGERRSRAQRTFAPLLPLHRQFTHAQGQKREKAGVQLPIPASAESWFRRDLYKLSIVTELCAHPVCKTYAWSMIITTVTIYRELIYAELRALHKLPRLIRTTTQWGRPYYVLQFENDETWDAQSFINLLQGIQPVNGSVKIQTQVCPLPAVLRTMKPGSIMLDSGNHRHQCHLGAFETWKIRRFHRRSIDSKSTKVEPRICTSIQLPHMTLMLT